MINKFQFKQLSYMKFVWRSSFSNSAVELETWAMLFKMHLSSNGVRIFKFPKKFSDFSFFTSVYNVWTSTDIREVPLTNKCSISSWRSENGWIYQTYMEDGYTLQILATLDILSFPQLEHSNVGSRKKK